MEGSTLHDITWFWLSTNVILCLLCWCGGRRQPRLPSSITSQQYVDYF